MNNFRAPQRKESAYEVTFQAVFSPAVADLQGVYPLRILFCSWMTPLTPADFQIAGERIPTRTKWVASLVALLWGFTVFGQINSWLSDRSGNWQDTNSWSAAFSSRHPSAGRPADSRKEAAD